MARRRWTPERDAELAEMVARGMGDRQIAEATRRTDSAVKARRSELGILRGPHRWTPRRWVRDGDGGFREVDA